MSHSHNHSHNHDHGHHHDTSSMTDKKLFWSVFLNLSITIAEYLGGFISNSLALLSDATHNLNDSMAILISYVARKISKKQRDEKRTYGYKRVEILAAFLNTVFLIAIAIILIFEGIDKIMNPGEINGQLMLWVSVVGLAGNLITAILLFRDSKENLNIKATFVHIISDTLSSVMIIVGAIFIMKYNWYILDPIFTFVISTYILFQSFGLIKEISNILIQGKPADLNIEEIKKEIEQLNFVENVHHIHVWTTDGIDLYFEGHVSLTTNCEYALDSYIKKINEILEEKFSINHSTIQLEKTLCK